MRQKATVINMKKNKWFHRGLYWEGIRQLRLTGVLMFVIFMIEAILVPVGYVVSSLSEASSRHQLYVHHVTGLSAHPIIVLAFVAAAPIMTFCLFGFMNKRNTSDFYHALPHTRTCMYISFMAAIGTWLAAIIVGSTAISMLTILIFHRFLILNVSSMLMLALNCLIASLLVCCVISVAMSITGTYFNNILLSGIILFLPRLLIALVCGIMADVLPILMENHIIPLMGSDYNIVTGSVFGTIGLLFGGFYESSSPDMILTSGKAAIYTFCLAAIYFSIGCVLFRKRPSEAAASAAPNRVLQTIYRVTVTMAYCSLVTCVLFDNIIQGHMDSMDIFVYIVFYIIAVLLYFIYELMTTKKWKNLLRAIPGLGIVLVLNGVLLGGLFGIYYTQLDFTPSAEEIKSISVLSETKSREIYDLASYFEQRIGTVKINDSETIRVISDALQKNVQNIRNKKKPYGQLENKNNTKELTCKIQTKFGARYRCVYIWEDDLQNIVEMLRKNENVRQIYMNLPEYREQDIILFGNTSLSRKQAKEIYDIMRYEVAVSDFALWYNHVNGLSLKTEPLYTFGVPVVLDMSTVQVNIPLYADICPQAAEKFIAYEKKAQQETVDQIRAILQNAVQNHDSYEKVYIELVDKNTGRWAAFDLTNDDDDQSKRASCYNFFLNLLDDEAAAKTDQCCAYVTVICFSQDGQTCEGSLNACIKLSNGFPDLNELPEFLLPFCEFK